MAPKIVLVAKTDAEIALEKRYDLLRQQRACTAAGPSGPGKGVGDRPNCDRKNTIGLGSSSRKPSPGGGGQAKRTPPKPKFVLKDPALPKPMTAFERTKAILANEAAKKRAEAETKAALQAMRNTNKTFGMDEPKFHIPKSAVAPAASEFAEIASASLPKKSPSLKRPASRAGGGVSLKKQRDGAFGTGASAEWEVGYDHQPQNGYQPTAIQRDEGQKTTSDPSSRTVFVADLPVGVDVASVSSTMYRFGNVEEVRIVAGRNFGFVTFTEFAGAAKAVRASEAFANDPTATQVTVNDTRVAITFAKGSGSTSGDTKNDVAYSLEIKNTALAMAGSAAEFRDAETPVAARDLVTYDDI